MKAKLKKFASETFSPLKNLNFRYYVFSRFISVSGFFVQQVALAWFVLEYTHSGTVLGITTALQYLPILFLAPYGGLLADRYSKRNLLIVL